MFCLIIIFCIDIKGNKKVIVSGIKDRFTRDILKGKVACFSGIFLTVWVIGRSELDSGWVDRMGIR